VVWPLHYTREPRSLLLQCLQNPRPTLRAKLAFLRVGHLYIIGEEHGSHIVSIILETKSITREYSMIKSYRHNSNKFKDIDMRLRSVLISYRL